MKYHIVHITKYIYPDWVNQSHSELRLTPKNYVGQTCVESTLRVEPQPYVIGTREDFFENKVNNFSIQQPHNTLIITVSSYVETHTQAIDPDDFPNTAAWEQFRDHLLTFDPDTLDIKQYLLESTLIRDTEGVLEYAQKSFITSKPFLEAVNDLMNGIHYDFEFKPGFTSVSTPLAEVMQLRKGVCQDFAHVAIACLRALGLAARYVSGYIETIPPPGEKKMVGTDASHAWVSVYIPELGWVDFDPTNNIFAGPKHIIIGWGRDYSDISPVKGVVYSDGVQQMLTSVDVSRVEE